MQHIEVRSSAPKSGTGELGRVRGRKVSERATAKVGHFPNTTRPLIGASLCFSWASSFPLQFGAF